MLKRSHITIAHHFVEVTSDPSTLDALAPIHLIQKGLDNLGIPNKTLEIASGKIWQHIPELADTIVFNLLESPDGAPYIESASVALLELLEVPFTGSNASTLWLTTDKLTTRAVLKANDLPVAPGGPITSEETAILSQVSPPWIIKPAREDASVGLEGNPVCQTTEQAISRTRDLAARFPGQPLLLEKFLSGREFNVSLLTTQTGVEVLPIGEISFVDFPPEMPPLVTFEAKWDIDSFAYIHTVRRFPTEDEDGELLHRIREIARQVWEICELRGYARVDFRLDELGNPYVLDVNANPDLSPDAGFMAAAAQAGLSPADAIGRIISPLWTA